MTEDGRTQERRKAEDALYAAFDSVSVSGLLKTLQAITDSYEEAVEEDHSWRPGAEEQRILQDARDILDRWTKTVWSIAYNQDER